MATRLKYTAVTEPVGAGSVDKLIERVNDAIEAACEVSGLEGRLVAYETHGRLFGAPLHVAILEISHQSRSSTARGPG